MEDDHESLQEQVKSFKNDDAVLEPGIANIFEEYIVTFVMHTYNHNVVETFLPELYV